MKDMKSYVAPDLKILYMDGCTDRTNGNIDDELITVGKALYFDVARCFRTFA